jgi:hypothetical protein
MTYSLKEALLLQKYYSDKMVGQIMDDSTQVKVKSIEIEQLEHDKIKYQVIVKSTLLKNLIVLNRDIITAAKYFKLPLPAVILTNQD